MDEAEKFFRAAWRRCEMQGECDAEDSAEYRRVYAEWLVAMRPYDVEKFIKARANLSAW